MIIQSFTAGVNYKTEAFGTAYPAPDFSARLLLRGTGAYEIPATLDGNGWVIDATATVTENYVKGAYRYFLQALDTSGGVFAIESGSIDIKENPAAMVAGDYRSPAEKALEAIEAKLNNSATLAQESYKINNRELKYVPLAQLINLRKQLKAEVAAQKSGGASGLKFIPVTLERG